LKKVIKNSSVNNLHQFKELTHTFGTGFSNVGGLTNNKQLLNEFQNYAENQGSVNFNHPKVKKQSNKNLTLNSGKKTLFNEFNRKESDVNDYDDDHNCGYNQNKPYLNVLQPYKPHEFKLFTTFIVHESEYKDFYADFYENVK